MAQIAYYFYCGSRLGCDENNKISFSVPSGNFGDIYAGYLAKKMGLGVNKLIIATNSNNILDRFVKKNNYSKEDMVETMTPSMNIQVSSNFERLLFNYHNDCGQGSKMKDLMANFEKEGSLQVDAQILKKIQKEFLSDSANDAQTKESIKYYYENCEEVLDPHTAVGTYVAKKYIESDAYEQEPVVTLATAHPAKFPDAVKEAIAVDPKLPEFLNDLLEREEKFEVLDNDFEAVKSFVSNLV